MGDLSLRLRRATRPPQADAAGGEDRALAKLRAEAARAGASLESDGEGGLPSSLVLGVMRRDKYTCKVCGSRDDLQVHHKGGIVESEWLRKKGHSNDPNNIVTICKACHDNVHNRAREAGVDSSQQGGK